MTCQQLLDRAKSVTSPDGKFSLVIKGKWADKKRLCGRRGPFGESIADVGDNEVLVVFEAQKVIDFLEKTRREWERPLNRVQ